MVPTATDSLENRAPTFAAGAWVALLTGWILMDGANAAWGWTRPAESAYLLVTVAVPVAGALLVVTQVRLGRHLGGLGWAGRAGVGVTALGAVVGLVAWAVPVWSTLMMVGMLVFGAAMLRRGPVPRMAALAFTLALVPTALATLAGLPDTWTSVPLAASALSLAYGVRGIGEWLSTGDGPPTGS